MFDEEMQKSRQYEKEIHELNRTIKSRGKEIEELKIKLQNNDIQKPTKKKRKINTEDSDSQTSRDKRNNGESERLKEVNEDLNARLNNEDLTKQMDKSITERFEAMQSNLMKLMDKRLDELSNIQFKTYASTVQANIVNRNTKHNGSKSNEDSEKFNMIVMKAKNEEILEEKDKKERELNILIHGRKEPSHIQDDFIFVQHFIDTVKEDVLPNAVIRIGKHNPTKTRPIKITFKTLTDKEMIMKNLRNLKDREEFTGLHIREDYTIAERMMIKDYVAKAREKNDMEEETSKTVWKVRGNPRSGLFLKKFLTHETDESRNKQ